MSQALLQHGLEEAGCWTILVRHWNHLESITSCQKHVDKHPWLWILAIVPFASPWETENTREGRAIMHGRECSCWWARLVLIPWPKAIKTSEVHILVSLLNGNAGFMNERLTANYLLLRPQCLRYAFGHSPNAAVGKVKTSWTLGSQKVELCEEQLKRLYLKANPSCSALFGSATFQKTQHCPALVRPFLLASVPIQFNQSKVTACDSWVREPLNAAPQERLEYDRSMLLCNGYLERPYCIFAFMFMSNSSSLTCELRTLSETWCEHVQFRSIQYTYVYIHHNSSFCLMGMGWF